MTGLKRLVARRVPMQDVGRPEGADRTDPKSSRHSTQETMNDTDISHRIRAECASFLQSVRWSHFATLTTRELVSVDRIKREVVHGFARRVARAAQRPLAWFYAIEPHADGERYHVHALLAHTEVLEIGQLERAWKLGNTRIVVYDPQRGAADYVSKHLAYNPDLYDLSRRPLPRRVLNADAQEAA